jgi:hypothetical protein
MIGKKLRLEDVASLLVFLTPLFFLTVPRWTNTISFLIFIISSIVVFTRFDFYFKNRSRKFWLFLFWIVAPFLCEVFAQVARWTISPHSLDSPSRFLIGGLFFILLSRLEIKYPLRFFASGALVSIPLAVAALYLLSTSPFEVARTHTVWGGRWAMNFSDPINTSLYLVALFGIGIFLQSTDKYRLFFLVLKLIIGALALVAIVNSQSRASWLAAVVMLVTVIFLFSHRKYLFVSSIVVPIGVCIALFYSSPIVNERIAMGVSDVHNYRDGITNTSIGTRLELIKLDLHLIKSYPVSGLDDRLLPSFNQLKEDIPSINRDLYEVRLLAGSHSEILSQLSRKGIFLGLLTTFAFFVIPVIYGWRHIASESEKEKISVYGALLFVQALFVGGLAIQVFNLKMNSTLYALFLAVLYAHIFNERMASPVATSEHGDKQRDQSRQK